MTDNFLDECECGDLRQDHKDGTGECRFNSTDRNGGLTHGFKACRRFKLNKAHKEGGDENE